MKRRILAILILLIAAVLLIINAREPEGVLLEAAGYRFEMSPLTLLGALCGLFGLIMTIGLIIRIIRSGFSGLITLFGGGYKKATENFLAAHAYGLIGARENGKSFLRRAGRYYKNTPNFKFLNAFLAPVGEAPLPEEVLNNKILSAPAAYLQAQAALKRDDKNAFLDFASASESYQENPDFLAEILAVCFESKDSAPRRNQKARRRPHRLFKGRGGAEK